MGDARALIPSSISSDALPLVIPTASPSHQSLASDDGTATSGSGGTTSSSALTAPRSPGRPTRLPLPPPTTPSSTETEDDPTWMRVLAWILAGIAGLPFASMAFGAWQHTSSKNYSKEWLGQLTGGQIFLDSITSLAALLINAFISRHAIPKSIKTLAKKIKNYTKNPWENTIIFILGIVAVFTPIGLGCSAFVWTGYNWINYIATGIYTLVFEGTRIFGLFNLFKWARQKYYQQQYINSLTHLRESYLKQLNQKLNQVLANRRLGITKAEDEAIIIDAFQQLNSILENQPQTEWQNEKTWAEWAWTALAIVLVILTLYTIFPTYAQQSFHGLSYVFGNTGSNFWDGLINGILSIGTPALFARQMITLKDRYDDAKANTSNRSIGWQLFVYLGLPIISFLSCLGVYNLTLGAAQDSDNLYKDIIPTPPSSSHPAPSPITQALPIPTTTPTPSSTSSTAWTAFQCSAAGLAGLTNLNFSLEHWAEHPHKIKEGKEDGTEAKAISTRTSSVVTGASTLKVKSPPTIVTQPTTQVDWVSDIARYMNQYSVSETTRAQLSKLSMFSKQGTPTTNTGPASASTYVYTPF